MWKTKWFREEEFIVSRDHPNLLDGFIPTEHQERASFWLATFILDLMRDYVRVPIWINSGIRTPTLNRAEGGSLTSQHMEGEAADISCDKLDQCAAWLRDHVNSQIRYYPDRGFIHVSLCRGDLPQYFKVLAGGRV